MAYKHIFGPVPSRRLGLSLGVDLMPHKTDEAKRLAAISRRTLDRMLSERRELSDAELAMLPQLDPPVIELTIVEPPKSEPGTPLAVLFL